MPEPDEEPGLDKVSGVEDELTRRGVGVGIIDDDDQPTQTTYVSREPSTPRQHKKRSKSDLLTKPPMSFDHKCTLGFVRMELLGQNDDVLTYKAQLFKDNMMNISPNINDSESIERKILLAVMEYED